ncbi:DUF3168 domain-containing protein [uncultured Amaricoccus sp.]|uniref:tail completion protein gp17 n=1 Tax=uncultured Amaricoccus sp. TaxID=339341 RepID=UPI00260C36D8|nr:DUF3168 domain-containing protein [uncultured Amaricoccus sp.]
MEEDLRALLIADAGVAAAVAARVSWGGRPQGSDLPAILLHLVARPGAHLLDGPSGLVESRVQVDCWGRTYAGAKLAARAAERALDGFGRVGSGVIGGTRFQGIFRIVSRDMSEARIVDGGDVVEQLFATSMDFSIRHQEEP